ncbi:MAG TPA: hypothetical protein VGF60_13760 [Xanthobacteraceae bacterium]|jgi:hypothetical protein
MRAIFIAALVASGIGLLGSPPSRAAPMSGSAIGQASELGRVVDPAHWHWRRHHRHHCWWGHRRAHCGWW